MDKILLSLELPAYRIGSIEPELAQVAHMLDEHLIRPLPRIRLIRERLQRLAASLHDDTALAEMVRSISIDVHEDAPDILGTVTATVHLIANLNDGGQQVFGVYGKPFGNTLQFDVDAH